MLLHYHRISSTGARGQRRKQFFVAAFRAAPPSPPRRPAATGESRISAERNFGPASPTGDFIASTQTFSPMIPRCHVVISHVNTLRLQFSTQLVYQSYIFLIGQVFWLLVSFYLNCVCTRQVLLLINAAYFVISRRNVLLCMF